MASRRRSRRRPTSAAASYVLGPNDRIRLKVYGEPDIAGEYEVDSNGQVSIPLAGHIRAAGLTTRQLERSIASTLAKGIVRDPRVNVEIALYRPYYILGEVKKGGEYPYRLGLTVMDAVASAGGFTYRANENKVLSAAIGCRCRRGLCARRTDSGFSRRQHPDSGALFLTSLRHRSASHDTCAPEPTRRRRVGRRHSVVALRCKFFCSAENFFLVTHVASKEEAFRSDDAMFR